MSTKDRGFASMDEDRQREISAKGGHASHGGGRPKSDDIDDDASGSRSGGRNRASQSDKVGSRGKH